MTSELRVDKIHNEGGDNDSGLDMSTNDVVKVNIAGSEKMRVHSDGLVGIGETTPTSALHVKGGAGANIAVQSTAGSHWRIGDAVGSSNGTFVIYDYTNSQVRNTINSSGAQQMLGNYASGYMLDVRNDGNNVNRYGVHIQCGQDTPSGSADTVM